MSDWGFTRNYGCNTAIASEHMLTFRSAAAGFYDMSRDGGTGNFGGFRSGCTSNLLVADGVLNAPDYTRTCTCSYPNQTSLALVPMPDVEMWTFNHLTYSGKPVRRVGINFGAPGDRRADNATLWIEHPSVGGTSPVIPIDITPANHRYTRYHATHVSGPGLDWVAASGIEGAEEIKIQLAADATQDRNYTVRLHFADTAQHEPGRRVFDVALNGRNVLTDFDIVRDADGPNRSLVKTFADIAADTELRITLTAKTGKTLLGGVEIITQE
jgi:hypothetical protein